MPVTVTARRAAGSGVETRRGWAEAADRGTDRGEGRDLVVTVS